jgi:spore germination cell wall hydrolase CwlJ-like protein
LSSSYVKESILNPICDENLIARKALNRQLEDRSDGALYFHHRKVTPNWSNEYTRTVEVGEHVFYKPAGGKAK